MTKPVWIESQDIRGVTWMMRSKGRAYFVNRNSGDMHYRAAVLDGAAEFAFAPVGTPNTFHTLADAKTACEEHAQRGEA